ncbi:hypothetical protein [Lysobacter sp. CA196]|uniref:hypothetical protein n=1 Tax=Lysobacter sp. CA196 TaxID=3455606 RepID=UPI003F8D3467
MGKPEHPPKLKSQPKLSRAATVYRPLAVIVLLLLVLAAAAMDPFVPSLQAAWLGPVLSLLAVAATMAVAVRYGKPELASWADRRDAAILALLLVGFFFVLHIVLRFCVPLSLHHLAGPQPATQIETVRVHEQSYRGCRSGVLLPGDGFLLHRRVCSVPKVTLEALRDSGRIELRGKRSYFGMQVEDYAVAPPAAR